MAPKLSTLKPLSAGDVILESIAILHVIVDEFKGKNCDNCLTQYANLKKCAKCRKMWYCDKECQQMDWKHHKNECKLFRHKNFKLNKSSEYERLLIRLLLTIKSDETFATKRYELPDGSDVSLNDIEVDSNQLLSNPIRMMEFETIISHLKAYEFDFNGLEMKDLHRWFGVVVCSPISLLATSYVQRWEVPENFAAEEGINPKDGYMVRYDMTPDVSRGLFPELCSVGHSCQPNAFLVTNGIPLQVVMNCMLQLKASQPISAGTNITRSYVFLAKNKFDRELDLKLKHLITKCDCLKCELNLDSDIDYRKYLRMYMKLADTLSEIEMDVQQTLSKPKRYPLKNYKQLFDYMKEMEKRIYGEISIEFGDSLLKIRLISRFANESCGKPWNKAIEQELEDNYKLVFGEDHPHYYKFRMDGNGTAMAKGGRMWRDKLRGIKIDDYEDV